MSVPSDTNLLTPFFRSQILRRRSQTRVQARKPRSRPSFLTQKSELLPRKLSTRVPNKKKVQIRRKTPKRAPQHLTCIHRSRKSTVADGIGVRKPRTTLRSKVWPTMCWEGLFPLQNHVISILTEFHTCLQMVKLCITKSTCKLVAGLHRQARLSQHRLLLLLK